MKTLKNLLILFFTLTLVSCIKESFTSQPSAFLKTSTDSIHFDTVFTSTGSVSQVFTIVNDNKKGIHISSVRVAGGSLSPFKINVDGLPGPDVMNVDVAANDSIYVFVTVAIDPTSSQMPFIIRDSIEIKYNGKKKYIPLDAYGRNARFLRNKKISFSETWNNDLPYVILDKLTIDSNALLTIDPGCRIYIHADAPFLVNGTLKINGQKEDSARVVFSGDRLDEPYRDFPASYPGLVFTSSSKNSVLNYTTIKNAYQGIVVNEPAVGTKLIMNQVVIDNAFDAGILGINTSITAINVLISNCGKNVLLVKGGTYNFIHCTSVSYSNNFIQHREPVVVATDFAGGVSNPLNAIFQNCILWGEPNGLVSNEVVVSKQSAIGSVVFDKVLWRVQTNPQNSMISGAINNQYPLFDSTYSKMNYRRFRLLENSPAINKGSSNGIVIDLEGNSRPVGLPDLGVFEKQ